MTDFEKLLRIFDRIVAVNSEPRPHPAASLEVVRQTFSVLDLPLPPVLEKVYTWHDGIDNLNAFLYFLPLARAAKEYRLLEQSWIEGMPPLLEQPLFPVLSLNGDITYCLDVRGGEFWAIDPEDGTARLLARRYEDLLDAVFQAFERGLATYDSDAGEFVISQRDWDDLRRSHGLE